MSDNDRRFTVGLIAEVFAVLERHGYCRPAENLHRATGQSIGALLKLVETFEGHGLEPATPDVPAASSDGRLACGGSHASERGRAAKGRRP